MDEILELLAGWAASGRRHDCDLEQSFRNTTYLFQQLSLDFGVMMVFSYVTKYSLGGNKDKI